MLCTLFNNGALIYSAPGFFWKLSQFWIFLLLSLRLSLHIPNPGFQHPAPCCPGDTLLRMWRTGQWHRPCVQLLLCPAFHRRIASFSSDPPKVPFCPSWLPHHEWAFLSVGASPYLQFPTSSAGLLLFPLFFLFFFLFFIITGQVRIFLILLGVWGLPLVFSWCFLRIVPFIGVFLMLAWREANFMSS